MIATRRQFLKAGAAGGAALALRIPLLGEEPRTRAMRFAPNQWLRVARDGWITLVIARSEMGQGVRTSLAAILADELEADWKTVSVEQASPGPEYEDMNTGGSDSVAASWALLRKAAAAAREMLLEAAARTWKVDREACQAASGWVLHAPTGRKLSYGRLVPLAATLPVPAQPALKDSKDFRLIGTRVPRIDGPAIVSGRAVYGLDIRVPGMLFAAVARCPVPGGKAARVDASKAKAVSGVRGVVPISGGIAVVAGDSWAAFSGRDALRVAWDEGPNATLTTEELWRRLDEAAAHPTHVSRNEGDVDAALAAAATRLTATYRDAFQAHAPLEPMNATARIVAGRCEVWAPTQNPQRVQKEAAALLGIAPDKVTVHVTLIGGGFGRRLSADYATEAVELARAVKRPVQIVWSRKDDFEHDRLHPAGRVDLEAGLDGSGRITAWSHRFTTFHLSMFGAFNPDEVEQPDVNPWGGYDNPYAIPNLRAEWTDVESPIHTGAWRAVFYPPNVFARECFLDEIAHRAGRDPLDFRRKLLSGDFPFAMRKVDRSELRTVLDLAAAKGGWGTPLAPRAGRRSGRGIACNVYHGRTLLAHVAEVSVGGAGDVRVHRIVTATDCGQVVNLSGLEGQVESGVAWGLSYALKGETTIRDGRVAESTYRDFPVLGIDEMPEIEVHVVASGKPPSGFGEQPVPPVAPAVANAIFAATGKRVRKLPIRPADLA
ncbi:MAG TPA: molybdopterin cofactor-binding domain-containing protein [Thermoanaerobaculia bacterium]|jgi:isoquinoline 1-oxidoreductase beta subunit